MRWKLSRAVLALAVAVVAVGAVPAQAGIARGSFHQTNLVSNIPGMAAITDSDLVNPWGLSSSATSPPLNISTRAPRTPIFVRRSSSASLVCDVTVATPREIPRRTRKPSTMHRLSLP